MSNFWKINKNHHGVKARTEWEYRLYYNDDGSVITYTTDDISGNYIVVEREIYAQFRQDVVVRNGQVFNPNRTTQYRKLVPSSEGTETQVDDITLIGPGQKWKLKYYD